MPQTDIEKYVKLSRVVAYFLREYKKSGGDRDDAWLLALRGYAFMGFNTNWEPITLRLPVLGNMTVQLPDDYINWSKIGILNASNEVSTLKVNRSLTTLKDTNPNRTSYLNPDTPNMDFGDLVLNPYFLNYYFGNWYTPLFGLGNGLVEYGSVVVDEVNKLIILGPGYPFNDLMLEYISAPERNGDFMVETCMQEALIAFMAWHMKLDTEANFYLRYQEGRRMLPKKRFTLQTLNQAIRSNHGYKVKN